MSIEIKEVTVKSILIDGMQSFNIPAWAKWVAFDYDGEAWAFENKPKAIESIRSWCVTSGDSMIECIGEYPGLRNDWQDLIIEVK